MQELTLDQLKKAIRDAEYLADLKHLVGPSDEEYDQAHARQTQMRELCDKALQENWGTVAHQWPHPHNETFRELFEEQQHFKSQYDWGSQ